jgi:hypothetical protein
VCPTPSSSAIHRNPAHQTHSPVIMAAGRALAAALTVVLAAAATHQRHSATLRGHHGRAANTALRLQSRRDSAPEPLHSPFRFVTRERPGEKNPKIALPSSRCTEQFYLLLAGRSVFNYCTCVTSCVPTGPESAAEGEETIFTLSTVVNSSRRKNSSSSSSNDKNRVVVRITGPQVQDALKTLMLSETLNVGETNGLCAVCSQFQVRADSSVCCLL